MRKIKILALFVVGTVLILGGIIYYKRPVKVTKHQPTAADRAAEEADLHKAEELMSQGKREEALGIIHKYEGQLTIKGELSRKWVDLLIEANIQSANFEQLMVLYEAFPKAFEENEKASLMAADGYILAGKAHDYDLIREEWRDKATLADMWFILDVDVMLLEGRREDALRLLNSRKLEGKEEIERLVRLALWHVNDNPKIAWDYLAEANALDPQNTSIISYRAKLLESLGQNSLALYEYLAAAQAAPDNVLLRDQLAEYYMRRNQVSLAISIWLQTLVKPSLDLIWIKALFWSKVVSPITFEWKKASPPTGADKEFIEYLAALPQGTFWDSEAFEKLPNANKFLSGLQVTFWLRLLQDLKNGDEKAARALLQFNAFSHDILNPQLENSLKLVLNYRLLGSFNDPKALEKPQDANQEQTGASDKGGQKGNETFFDQLNVFAANQLKSETTQKIPEDIHAFLMSKDIFSSLFLAAGWLEAALQLHEMPVYPNNFPEWVPYGMTQALRTNRSPGQALDFALHQNKTPALSLLIAELYMADKKPDEALSYLDPYIKDDSAIGFRASLLASLIYVDKQEFQKAKEIIEAHPKLTEDTLGKEALARIALLQGNVDLADKLYAQLRDRSPEAMSYLARKAYAEKDWKRAQELTQQLLLTFPDNPVLRENLNQVMQEQKIQQAQ